MTAAWTPQELERIGAADELELTVGRRTVTIWVVRAGDRLYVRSWHGPSGNWFAAARSTHTARVRAGRIDRDVELTEAGDNVNDAVDDAYRTKYGRYPGYVEPMVRPDARATTLELVPLPQSAA